MKTEQTIHALLVSDLKERGLKAWKIKEGTQSNPYPIGSRAVWFFAKKEQATDSHKWKMLVYFENEGLF